MKDYSNAYAEAYIILSYLDEEEFEKIPKEIIEVIESKRNMEYSYEINEELDLTNQPMLPETKALLFNLFRDYLSTPEQKEKIKRMQQEDRWKAEEKRKQEYGEINIFERKQKVEIDIEEGIEETYPVVINNENIFKKIISFIKNIFRKNKLK